MRGVRGGGGGGGGDCHVEYELSWAGVDAEFLWWWGVGGGVSELVSE